MIFSLDQIIGWLVVYRYFILFPVMVLEGPIITIIAGFLSSLELLNPFLVYAVVVIADLFGDFVYYAIGRWGRKNFINKWGKYIGLSAAKIIRLESHFEKHTRKTLIFGKYNCFRLLGQTGKRSASCNQNNYFPNPSKKP